MKLHTPFKMKGSPNKFNTAAQASGATNVNRKINESQRVAGAQAGAPTSTPGAQPTQTTNMLPGLTPDTAATSRRQLTGSEQFQFISSEIKKGGLKQGLSLAKRKLGAYQRGGVEKASYYGISGGGNIGMTPETTHPSLNIPATVAEVPPSPTPPQAPPPEVVNTENAQTKVAMNQRLPGIAG